LKMDLPEWSSFPSIQTLHHRKLRNVADGVELQEIPLQRQTCPQLSVFNHPKTQSKFSDKILPAQFGN
jgi:hypothetical protein